MTGKDAAPAPALRPKDAATLIVLRRDADATRVLMGRRSEGHAFMPGAMVFPGGRVDRADWRAPTADALQPMVQEKLLANMGNADPRRARAIALAAIRETYEETGVLIGRKVDTVPRSRAPGWRPFLEAGVVPTLSPLRLIARAITPPGRTRRFDARFFAVFDEAIAGEVDVPDDELQEPAWLSFAEARSSNLMRITQAVLNRLEARLEQDPDLAGDAPIPFYFARRGKFVEDRL